MDLSTLTERAKGAMAASDFDKKVKFDFGDVGNLFLDGQNNTASNEDAEADATVKVDFDDFKKMAAGEMDPTMAFMQGKLKVLGDMSVAMKLQSILKNLA